MDASPWSLSVPETPEMRLRLSELINANMAMDVEHVILSRLVAGRTRTRRLCVTVSHIELVLHGPLVPAKVQPSCSHDV